MHNGNRYTTVDWDIVGTNMLLSREFMTAFAEGYMGAPFRYDAAINGDSKLYECARGMGLHLRLSKTPWPRLPGDMEKLYFASMRDDTRPRREWQNQQSTEVIYWRKFPPLPSQEKEFTNA